MSPQFPRRSLLSALAFAGLLVAAVAPTAAAQSYWQRTTTLYVEAMGGGGVGSVNIERLVGEKLAVRFGLGGGLGYYDEDLVAPATISQLVGGPFDYLEVGVGMAFVAVPDDAVLADLLYDHPESHVAATGIVGYRHMSDGGLLLRMAFTPFYNEEGFVPMGGAAVGYSF